MNLMRDLLKRRESRFMRIYLLGRIRPPGLNFTASVVYYSVFYAFITSSQRSLSKDF